jgi:hypothetical protein
MGPKIYVDCGRGDWGKTAGNLHLAKQIIGKPREPGIVGGMGIIPQETVTRPWKHFEKAGPIA